MGKRSKKGKSKGKSPASTGIVNNSTEGETPPGAPFPKLPTLWKAVDADVDPKLLLCLIQEGGDVNGRNGSSHVPLHLAAELGRFELLKVLLENGAEPDILDGEEGEGEGHTPLYFAFYNFIPGEYASTSGTEQRGEHMKCIKELIRFGANPNSVDHNGMPPPGHPFAAQFAMHSLLNPGTTTLMHVYAEHLCEDPSRVLETEVMDFLAELGTDFDQQATFIKMELFHNSWYTTTPLQMAVKAGHVELVKALIQKGCKVDQQHLLLAYQKKKTECARILQMKLLSA